MRSGTRRNTSGSGTYESESAGSNHTIITRIYYPLLCDTNNYCIMNKSQDSHSDTNVSQHISEPWLLVYLVLYKADCWLLPTATLWCISSTKDTSVPLVPVQQGSNRCTWLRVQTNWVLQAGSLAQLWKYNSLVNSLNS